MTTTATVEYTQPVPTGDPVVDAANRIRFWLVQSFRYTAGTLELQDVLEREIRQAIEETQHGVS